MKASKKKLKMGELVKSSGVPKSTIIFYIKEGLLPEPERTGPNMAYYDESTIERIKYIKSLQQRYYPLSRIKEFLKAIDAGASTEISLEMDQVIFQPKQAEARFYNQKEFLETTGLTEEELKKAEELKVIVPLARTGDMKYDEEDARIGRVLLGSLRMGHGWDWFSVYSECAEKISEHEMARRNAIVEGLDIDTTLQMTTFLVKIAEEIRSYVFRRHLQQKAEIQREKELKELQER